MADVNQTAGGDVDHKELDRLLQQAFDAASELYKKRGFQRRIGFGKRPALVSVDLAHATKIRWIMRLCRQCKNCLMHFVQMAVRWCM
jgi:hypothetical protein